MKGKITLPAHLFYAASLFAWKTKSDSRETLRAVNLEKIHPGYRLVATDGRMLGVILVEKADITMSGDLEDGGKSIRIPIPELKRLGFYEMSSKKKPIQSLHIEYYPKNGNEVYGHIFEFTLETYGKGKYKQEIHTENLNFPRWQQVLPNGDPVKLNPVFNPDFMNIFQQAARIASQSETVRGVRIEGFGKDPELCGMAVQTAWDRVFGYVMPMRWDHKMNGIPAFVSCEKKAV